MTPSDRVTPLLDCCGMIHCGASQNVQPEVLSRHGHPARQVTPDPERDAADATADGLSGCGAFKSSKTLLLIAGTTGIFSALAHRAMDKASARLCVRLKASPSR